MSCEQNIYKNVLLKKILLRESLEMIIFQERAIDNLLHAKAGR